MRATGEVTERLNVPVSKTGIRASVSWVRIPPSPPPVCLHRTGCRHALQRAAQQAGGPGQRGNHARLRAPVADAHSPCHLARKLAALEKRYDAQFKVVFEAIRELMTPPPEKKRPIGFTSWPERK